MNGCQWKATEKAYLDNKQNKKCSDCKYFFDTKKEYYPPRNQTTQKIKGGCNKYHVRISYDVQAKNCPYFKKKETKGAE